MLRRLSLSGLLWLLLADTAYAEDVRYFAVWSYAQNAPAEEVAADDRSGRTLGYWALEFDVEGRVLGGVYHGADGTAWLSIRYALEDGRVYADIFAPDGSYRTRKSTNLSSRLPSWPGPR